LYGSQILHGLLTNKKIRIPIKKKLGTPPTPALSYIWGVKGGIFKSCPRVSKLLDMTFEGLGKMFEGDSADMCARKFPLVSRGGRAEGLACADPGARTPIGASGNFKHTHNTSTLHRVRNIVTLARDRQDLGIYTLFNIYMPDKNTRQCTVHYAPLYTGCRNKMGLIFSARKH
jgi:hypothetical protein